MSPRNLATRKPARRTWVSPLATLVLLSLVPRVARAVGAVSALQVERSGADLVLTWSPPSGAVDGYRVYRASDRACTSLTRLYEGIATTFTDAGAFQDMSAALYGVSAFAGSDEGPATGPVYKYPLTVPVPSDPIGNGFHLVSLPFDPGPADAKQLCDEIRLLVPTGTRVARYNQVDELLERYNCDLPSLPPCFLTSQEGYYVRSLYQPLTLLAWGIGSTPWTYRFDRAWAASPDQCDAGLIRTALPYDHAYPDLMAIAAELPAAVRVALWNPEAGFCPDQLVGLSRPTSADPWAGSNLSLAGRDGVGVVLAFETVPVVWTPRRLCTVLDGGLPGNLPPVAVPGGPYDSALCQGGVIAIWLDGTASFDPDAGGPLLYRWTSACSGTITDPQAALTPALFDCNPCLPLACQVTLTVTDAPGATHAASAPVSSRQVTSCLAAGNSLRVTRSAGQLVLDWSAAPPAENYVLLGDDEKAWGSPAHLGCSPATGAAMAPGAPGFEVYAVDGMNEPCWPR